MFFHALTFAGFRVSINFRWVPSEVFNNTRGTQGMLMHGKNMFDRYYCIKESKKSILERYFDVFF